MAAIAPARNVSSFNAFLRSIPTADADRMFHSARRQNLGARQMLFDVGDAPKTVYFPEKGTVVALAQVFRGGDVIDSGIIGAEGIAGFDALLGTGARTSRALLPAGGTVVAVDAELMRDVIRSRPQLQDVLLGFMHAFVVQLSQTAACNRMHDVQQRVARSLLFLRDRSESSTICITHETLSQMVGSRRAGVTFALGVLEEQGLVHRGRSRITVTDGLENASCECYGQMAAMYRQFAEV